MEESNLFIDSVAPRFRDFVSLIHEFLLESVLKPQNIVCFGQKWSFRCQKSSKSGSLSCGFFLEPPHFWSKIQHFSGLKTEECRILDHPQPISKRNRKLYLPV